MLTTRREEDGALRCRLLGGDAVCAPADAYHRRGGGPSARRSARGGLFGGWSCTTASMGYGGSSGGVPNLTLTAQQAARAAAVAQARDDCVRAHVPRLLLQRDATWTQAVLRQAACPRPPRRRGPRADALEPLLEPAAPRACCCAASVAAERAEVGAKQPKSAALVVRTLYGGGAVEPVTLPPDTIEPQSPMSTSGAPPPSPPRGVEGSERGAGRCGLDRRPCGRKPAVTGRPLGVGGGAFAETITSNRGLSPL